MASASSPSASVRLGTGFFITSEATMLTNRHVIEGCRRIVVVPEDGRSYRASVVAISGSYDLAAIQVERYKPKSYLPMRAFERNVSMPEDGEEVMTGGFSDPKASRERISVVHGIVHTSTAASNRQPFNSRMLSSIRAGASGSPVIDAGGSFLGVIHSGTREFDQQLPGKYSRFDVIAVFHNNNAVAEFLTKEGIDFFFRGQTRLLPKFEQVGLLYNVTALIECN